MRERSKEMENVSRIDESEMTAPPREPHTFAEFVAWESQQATKHEFVDGRVLAFAGGTLGHSDLAAELIARIRPHARPCRTLRSDALIQTKES